MPDRQIFRGADHAGTSTFTLPDGAEYLLKCVNADFDGSGAAEFLPCVTLVSDSGHVIARAVDQDVSVAAGGSAEVSFFQHVRRKRGTTPAGGPSCALLGSGNGNTTLTITLSAAVPATGTLHVVCGQASIPGAGDHGSQISGASDSGGLGPWRRPAIPNNAPLLGNSRSTTPTDSASIQLSSVARACVAGDLGVGSTITVTFSSAAPANFHTTGLVVYQPAYFVVLTQSDFGFYNHGDGYPDFGTNPSHLLWDEDYDPFDTVPLQDAHRIAALCTYPPLSGFAPADGTVIGEITSGTVGLVATCKALCQNQIHEPGGSWSGVAEAIAGQYQVAQPRVCTN